MLGQKLGGRYQIIKQLGKGAFGTTFLAQDTQRPGNPECVVKLLKPVKRDFNTLREAKRFFDQEAKILEALGNHDQIPRLFAHFEENQEFYLVQEYIEGHDLTEELYPGNQLSETEVIKLLREILEVLAFVHQQNVIHRDIKPSNIRRRQDGNIVLIDFGAVKEVNSLQAYEDGQTGLTVGIGTPGYMPSEQAKGEPKLSSDIYAVGIIAIFALTGIDPVPRPHQPGSGLPKNPQTGEIIWRDRLTKKVNPKLVNVIDKMMRDHFSQRYQSADEALLAIQSLSTKLPPPKVLIGVGATVALIPLFIIFSPRIFTPQANFLAYENPDFGIKIKYPENWSRQDIGNAITAEVVQFLSAKESQNDNFQENLTVSVENFSGTLQESTNSFINEIKNNLPESEIIDEAIITLANRPARQLVFTGKDGDITVKKLQIWALKGDKTYVIIYTANINDYDKFIPIAKKMIKSFEIE
jgi:serine/threonine-protein kinase